LGKLFCGNVTTSEEPCGRDGRASEIEYLFSVSFPLVGNPSDLFGNARKILDRSSTERGQEPEMTEIRNCGRNHRELQLIKDLNYRVLWFEDSGGRTILLTLER